MSKRSIKNKNRVEGCIVEAYLSREGSRFYSYYFDDQVSCLRNRPNRHADTEIDPAIQPISIFNQPSEGSKKRTLCKLTELEKKSAALHVLLNFPEIQPFLNYFVSQHGHDQVYPYFTTWYTHWVYNSENAATFDQFFKNISWGSITVHSMSQYNVNGFKFTTEKYSKNRKTNNSGVWVKGGDENHENLIILASYRRF